MKDDNNSTSIFDGTKSSFTFVHPSATVANVTILYNIYVTIFINNNNYEIKNNW